MSSSYTVFYEGNASMSDWKAWAKVGGATLIGAGTGLAIAAMPTSASAFTKVAIGSTAGLLSSGTTKLVVDGKMPNQYTGSDVADVAASTVAGGAGAYLGHLVGGIDKAFGMGMADAGTEAIEAVSGSIGSAAVEGAYLSVKKESHDTRGYIDNMGR